MPLANTQSRVTYAGNGVTDEFPTTFAFLANAHLVVELSDDDGDTWSTLTEGVDYNVDGAAAAEPGGTVEMLTVPAVGETLRITRETPITQLAELQTSGPLPAKTIIQAFDKVTMWGQELARRMAEQEAGSSPVDLTPEVVTDTFIAAEPIEDTFPRAVACAGTPAGVVLIDIRNLTTPAEVLRAEGLTLGPLVADEFTVEHLEGLTPGQQYRVKYLVINA